MSRELQDMLPATLDVLRTVCTRDARPASMFDIRASHCRTDTFVFSSTHVTKASFGHGAAGSWQYFVIQARVSSSEAGAPSKPGHWQFGYAPIFLHMSSQGTPSCRTFDCRRARAPFSWAPHLPKVSAFMCNSLSASAPSAMASTSTIPATHCIARN